MQNRLYLIDLYDIYAELLTEKQKNYFEAYYFDNLSLGEIAENNNVSRNAVHKQLKEVEEKTTKLNKELKDIEKEYQRVLKDKEKTDKDISSLKELKDSLSAKEKELIELSFKVNEKTSLISSFKELEEDISKAEKTDLFFTLDSI